MLPNDALGPIFLAAVEATEESIVNALVAARTMSGNNGYTVHALPHDRLQAALKKHGRLLPIERDSQNFFRGSLDD